MMQNSVLSLKKYLQKGYMKHEYNPLRNILNNNNEIINFRVKKFNTSLNNPINIECQPSYDGTVNLILNDDKNPPRIVNTRFSRLENNQYEIISRNQLIQTNLYDIDKVDQQTRLFRNLNKIPIINLVSVGPSGQLIGGNYSFYIKYGDNDYNQSDIVAESGKINIFNGYTPSSISGTILNERTNKSIKLSISNIDVSYQNLYIYYTIDTSDINGALLTRSFSIIDPIEIDADSKTITISGFEQSKEIDTEELNIKYNLVDSVKTQTQLQNMLFFGNTSNSHVNIIDLRNISLYIKVQIKQLGTSIGWVTNDYGITSTTSYGNMEYYNPITTYYKLGYWPNEIYRLGIVYIMSDDSLSPVFNLRGRVFNELDEYNYDGKSEYNSLELNNKMNYIPNTDYITSNSDATLVNTKGVFKTPSVDLYKNDAVHPIYFNINVYEYRNVLKKYGVKGYFIVRQPRIPLTLCQGFSIGIDIASHTPMLKYKDDYISESFIDANGKLTTRSVTRLLKTDLKRNSGLLSLDAMIVPQLQSEFNGSEFILELYKNVKLEQNQLKYYGKSYTIAKNDILELKSIYINSDVPLKHIGDYSFSTRAGSAEDARQFSFFSEINYDKNNTKLLRGIFTPFIGVCGNLQDNCIYNIKIQNYSDSLIKEYFNIRMNDESKFSAISDRYEIDKVITVDAFRGDCFTNTVTIRMHRNFIDPDSPVNELIVDDMTWANNYKGFTETSTEDWALVQRPDINTVPVGSWITFKCLSNYNLGLRSKDYTNVDEMSLMGGPRSFYPLSSINTSPSNKIEESYILNTGYSSTLNQKRYYPAPNVPYIKDMFDTRIMFSNVQMDDAFRNSYRVFQGMSYKDIDRQYGAIVKLLPLRTNLFCVFEHGLAIIPINEKALIQTDTNQSIHMYGAGVIQNQISLITPDFGSIWQESIIRTPVGIYGVDTTAKKIWRFSEESGFELISDMKIQRYLHDNIKLSENDKYPTIGIKNVKTHYNNYKGDVMFTFYNDRENTEWNLCYNERLDKWITRYSWIPICSENINNSFFSLDKKRVEVLSTIYDNKYGEFGIHTSNNEWIDTTSQFKSTITYKGYSLFDKFELTINEVKSSYLDSNDNEIIVTLPNNSITLTNSELTIPVTSLKYKGNSLYYFKINVTIKPSTTVSGTTVYGGEFKQNIGVVINRDKLSAEQQRKYGLLLVNGFYVHGRAGIFDEMDYTDNNPDNQIKPTHWYDKQEVFEFEFVVNNLPGYHKIFNDLNIISNNVEPDSISFEVIGDIYDFNKTGIYKHSTFKTDEFAYTNISQEFNSNVKIKYDHVLNQYSLVLTQKCKNLKDFGRLRGNIQYKNDSWFMVIDPIKFKRKIKIDANNIKTSNKEESVRIRDKFLKIRVRYTGENIVTIMALKTLMTVGY